MKIIAILFLFLTACANNQISSSVEQLNLKNHQEDLYLLTFWATWCPPCASELEELQQLEAQFAGKLKVIAISNESSDVLNSWLSKNSIKLQIINDNSLFERFNITALPSSMLVDPNFRIVQLPDPESEKIVNCLQGPVDWNNQILTNYFRKLLVNRAS